MRRVTSRILATLSAATFGAAAALLFAGCGNALDDCRNTRTCIPVPCADAGALASGDCCQEEDGGLSCAP